MNCRSFSPVRLVVCAWAFFILGGSHIQAQRITASSSREVASILTASPRGTIPGADVFGSSGSRGQPARPSGGPQYGTSGPALDFDLFEQELRSRLDGNCIGYSFAFNVNGTLERSGFGGVRRTAADGGALNQSAWKRMHIASIAKNITATATIRLLAMSGVSLDESIAGYLPLLWNVDSSVEDITFAHLLTHTSGYQQFGASTTYTNLKNSIADGADTALLNDYGYDNRNFGLLRILLPYAVCPDVMLEYEVQGFGDGDYDEVVDQMTSELYVWMVNKFVFEPAGIAQAKCMPNASDNQRTRFYNWPADGANGQDGGDWTRRSGGAGWVLSAVDLAQYMAYRRYTNNLLSENQRELMDLMQYGWQTTVGDWGTYLCHGGDFTVSGPLTGVIMQFPNCNVEAVLLINSNLQGPGKTTVLRNAFDAAWQ